MSTTLRVAWLGLLRRLGIRYFVARSSMGHHFVCHLGDSLGENPFYNRQAFRVELELCAAWLRQEKRPRIFDVGANVGFWSTHLAQMLTRDSLEIYAFEPVPTTFVKLVESVERLNLTECVHVIAAAVLDEARPVQLSYSPRDSLFAQVAGMERNRRVGDRLAHAASLTLDEFSATFDIVPTFVKIDVEGSEVNCLRGARRLLNRADRPSLMFEYNPLTLSETNSDRAAFRELLSGYTLHYVDDFEGQKRPIGDLVASTDGIGWVCNLFAIPSTADATARWTTALAIAKERLKHKAT